MTPTTKVYVENDQFVFLSVVEEILLLPIPLWIVLNPQSIPGEHQVYNI
jgi:hypothetical protein